MAQKVTVLAYPTFTEADRATIQAVRARHDPQFAMLDPHFTLVFPVEATPADVVTEARAVAREVTAFSVSLHSVRAVRDAFSAGGHVFLLPEQGGQEIAALNTRLYAGTLNWAHRRDIPYVPHITVAAFADFSECEALAARLAGDQRDMTGSVEVLTVVEVLGTRVITVAALPLGGGRTA